MVNKYQKHKEKLRKETCERYQNLSAEEIEKMQKEKIKMLETDIKIFLKKKKKKRLNI